MDNTKTHERILSLYSGGGGLDIGVAIGIGRPTKTICYVEREFTAIAVLEKAMQNGILDKAPLYTNSNTFDGKPFHNKVDWLIGGFPCQPFSVAGKMQTDKDERWLWDDIFRIICEIRPTNIFLENVSGVLVREGLGRILGDISTVGYDAEWSTFKAADVGSSHKRERVFILAYKQGTKPSMADPDSIRWRRGIEVDAKRSVKTETTGFERRTDATTKRNVDNTDNAGNGQRTTESQQNIQREDAKEFGVTGTANASRQSNAKRATEQSSTSKDNGRANNRKTNTANAKGFHNLASLYNDSGTVIEPNRTAKDDRRALVQKRKQILQLSNIDTMGIDKDSVSEFEEAGQIRQRNDDDRRQRMDQSKQTTMEDTKHTGRSAAEKRGNDDETISGTTQRQDRTSESTGADYSTITLRQPFPPKPSEKHAWQSIINERPDLSPALEKSTLEPEVRGMADGMAYRLDRVSRLRILGNGVVPLQSATALRLLVARIWRKL